MLTAVNGIFYNMAEQIDIKLNIQGDSIKAFREELKKTKQELDNTTDPKKAEKLSKSFAEGKNKLVDYNKQLRETKKATDSAVKSNTDLNATFEDIYGDVKPLSSRLGELEDRMYEMALAGEANSDEFRTLQKEAVRMRKTIIEVDKQVDILADNQGFSVFGDGLADVGTSLMRLDFETASKQAGSLANAAGNISFGSAIKSIKQLGSVFLNLGKALLTNPLFLIAAIVFAIIAAIVKLMDELGLLTVIFEAIGDAIGWVVQQLKDFLDWLGLTNYAEQDAAEKSAKAAEKRAKAYEEATSRITAALDHEIRMAELSGKDTEALERKKGERLRDTNEAQLEALKERYKAEKIKGDLDYKEMADLAKSVRDKRAQYKQSFKDIEYFNKKTKVERKKFNQEQRDNEALAAAQLSDDRVQGMIEQAKIERDIALREANLTASQKLLIEKQYNDQVLQIQEDDREQRWNNYKAARDRRIDAERQIQDAELELMQEGFDKQQKEIQLNYDRLIEDAKLNEELTQSERARLIELYGSQRIQAEQKVQAEISQAETERKEKSEADQQAEAIRMQEFYAKQDALAIEMMEEGYEKEKAIKTAQFEDKLARLQEEGLLTNEIEKQLRQQLQDDLLAIDKKALDEKKALSDREKQESKDLAEAKAKMAIDGIKLASGVAELFADRSSKAAEVAFNVNKAANIAQATMDGYKAVLSTYANAPGGPVLKGIQAGIAGGFAALQIANIAKSKFNAGGTASSFTSGGGATSTPTASFGSVQQAEQTPTMNINEGINQNAGGSTMREKVMVVDYTDIQNKGNELVQVENSFTLA